MNKREETDLQGDILIEMRAQATLARAERMICAGNHPGRWLRRAGLPDTSFQRAVEGAETDGIGNVGLRREGDRLQRRRVIAIANDEMELLAVDIGFVIVVVIDPAQDGSQVRRVILADGTAHNDLPIGERWSQHACVVADAAGGTRDLPFERGNCTVLRDIHIAAPFQAIRGRSPEGLIGPVKGVVRQGHNGRSGGG